MVNENWHYQYDVLNEQNSFYNQKVDYLRKLEEINFQPGQIYPMPGTPMPCGKQSKEGIEMKGVYDVYLVYAEDRKNIVKKQVVGVLADSDEDAKIKSGLMKGIKDDWDADYLTFIVRKIGDVKVKEKPKEVKQV